MCTLKYEKEYVKKILIRISYTLKEDYQKFSARISVASCFLANPPDAVQIQPKLPARPKIYPFFCEKIA